MKKNENTKKHTLEFNGWLLTQLDDLTAIPTSSDAFYKVEYPIHERVYIENEIDNIEDQKKYLENLVEKTFKENPAFLFWYSYKTDLVIYSIKSIISDEYDQVDDSFIGLFAYIRIRYTPKDDVRIKEKNIVKYTTFHFTLFSRMYMLNFANRYYPYELTGTSAIPELPTNKHLSGSFYVTITIPAFDESLIQTSETFIKFIAPLILRANNAYIASRPLLSSWLKVLGHTLTFQYVPMFHYTDDKISIIIYMHPRKIDNTHVIFMEPECIKLEYTSDWAGVPMQIDSPISNLPSSRFTIPELHFIWFSSLEDYYIFNVETTDIIQDTMPNYYHDIDGMHLCQICGSSLHLRKNIIRYNIDQGTPVYQIISSKDIVLRKRNPELNRVDEIYFSYFILRDLYIPKDYEQILSPNIQFLMINATSKDPNILSEFINELGDHMPEEWENPESYGTSIADICYIGSIHFKEDRSLHLYNIILEPFESSDKKKIIAPSNNEHNKNTENNNTLSYPSNLETFMKMITTLNQENSNSIKKDGIGTITMDNEDTETNSDEDEEKGNDV